MYNGETPTLYFDTAPWALDGMADVRVTLATPTATTTYGLDRLTVTGALVALELTQAETLALGKGRVKAQLNALDSEGRRYVSAPAVFEVDGNLLNEVM